MNEHDLLTGVADAARRLLEQSLICPTPETRLALDALHAKVQNLDSYYLHGHESSDRPHVKIKVCERCHANLFFAFDPGLDKWIPFELDPIPAAGLMPSLCYQVDFAGIDPIVRVNMRMGENAEVYVDHRQTCITSKMSYRCVPYERRRRVNVARADLQVDAAADQLRALKRRLQSTPPTSR